MKPYVTPCDTAVVAVRGSMASVAAGCIASLTDFFLLRDSEISFERVCMDTPYRKRLAFLGEAVLKPYVVKFLVARQGLQWIDLCPPRKQCILVCSV